MPFNCTPPPSRTELNWTELGHHQASKQTATIWWPQSIGGIHTTQIMTHQVRGIQLNEATARWEARTTQKGSHSYNVQNRHAYTSYSTLKNVMKGGSLDWWQKTWNLRPHWDQDTSTRTPKGLPEQSNTVWTSWLLEADVVTHILSHRALFLILSANPHSDIAAVLYFGRTPHWPPSCLNYIFFSFAVSHYYLGIHENNIPSETIKVSSLSAQ